MISNIQISMTYKNQYLIFSLLGLWVGGISGSWQISAVPRRLWPQALGLGFLHKSLVLFAPAPTFITFSLWRTKTHETTPNHPRTYKFLPDGNHRNVTWQKKWNENFNNREEMENDTTMQLAIILFWFLLKFIHTNYLSEIQLY